MFSSISVLSTQVRHLWLAEEALSTSPKSLYQTIERLVEHRHALVHRAVVVRSYDQDSALADVDTVPVAIERVYSELVRVNPDLRPWRPEVRAKIFTWRRTHGTL